MVHARIVRGEVRKWGFDESIATNTELGWIISSAAGVKTSNGLVSYHCIDNAHLDSLIEKFWTQEEILPPANALTPEEQECEDHFRRTHSRTSDGRYVVRLPLKPNAIGLNFHLGDSYSSALNALLSMERKFSKNPNFKEQYLSFMSEYRNLSHIHPAPQLTPRESQRWYFLPHHGVIQGAKKLRTVFNGSSKVNGVSLNDLLLPDPNLIPNLAELLMKWRSYRVVFVVDIQKNVQAGISGPSRSSFANDTGERESMQRGNALLALNLNLPT